MLEGLQGLCRYVLVSFCHMYVCLFVMCVLVG